MRHAVAFPIVWPPRGFYLLRDKKMSDTYKIAEAKFNERVDELCSSPDLATLRSEIGVLRALVEETLQATTPERRNLPMIRDLVKAIGQLVSAHRVAELEADRLLEKETVLGVGQAIVSIIVDELKEKFVGWEDTCDHISERIAAEISSVSNKRRRREPV
jgi:hypothetical protein